MARATLILVLVALVGSSAAAARGPLASGPLATAVWENQLYGTADAPVAFARVRAAGATYVRLGLSWNAVTPIERPSPFDPVNPADPAYANMVNFDRQVTLALANGLQPIVSVAQAPRWAERTPDDDRFLGNIEPNAQQLGQFATMLAIRYSGVYGGLPRVRHWQVWNEPNLSFYLSPQFRNGSPYSPGIYRKLVNAFSDAVKTVHKDNVVVAGGTAPFTSRFGDKSEFGLGPLAFMRSLLCLGTNLRPTCSSTTRFDVWAHHPYTSGGPTHQANFPNDVSLGDLPDMRRVLDAAIATGRIKSDMRPRFWVTEFSWDTSPPDPEGIPVALQSRWVSEAFYRMWQSGVSLVTWYLLRDEPMATSFYQSGLYARGSTIEKDRPKLTLRAFRFPFVAYLREGRVFVWGRTPSGKTGQVVVEQKRGAGWQRLTSLRAGPNGIFTTDAVRGARRVGHLRARVSSGDFTIPFSLREPPDKFYVPVGSLKLYPGR